MGPTTMATVTEEEDAATLASSDGCRRKTNGEDDIYQSPTAIQSNALLYGKFDEFVHGVLVRAPRLKPFERPKKGDRSNNKKKKKKKKKDGDDEKEEENEATTKMSTAEESEEHPPKIEQESRTPYLPASFLHASIRAPNAIFSPHFERRKPRDATKPYELPTIALLIGSKNGLNRPLPPKRTNESGEEEAVEENVVTCSGFYPIDSWSGKRKPLVEGTSCYKGDRSNIRGKDLFCVSNDNDGDGEGNDQGGTEHGQQEEVCLTKPKSDCECNFTAMPGKNYASHLQAYIDARYQTDQKKRRHDDDEEEAEEEEDDEETAAAKDDGENEEDPDRKEKLRRRQERRKQQHLDRHKLQFKHMHKAICWARSTPPQHGSTTHHHGLSHTIDASNSLYLHRNDLYQTEERIHDHDYWGWTECTASSNIEDVDMIDAIVIKLPPRADDDGRNTNAMTSLCSLNEEGLEFVRASLDELYWSYGYASLPVVVLTETKGMADEDECHEFWDGMRCDEGYRKEFVSQTLDFDDGSCLSRRRSRPSLASAMVSWKSWMAGHRLDDYGEEEEEGEEVYFYPANATESPCRSSVLNSSEESPLLHLRSLHASVGLLLAKTYNHPSLEEIFPLSSSSWQAGNGAVVIAVLFLVVASVVFFWMKQSRVRIRSHGGRRRIVSGKGDKQA